MPCSSVVVSALQYMLLQSVGLSGCVTGAGQDTWAGHLLPNCPTLPLRTLDSSIISLPVKPLLDHTAVVSLPVKCGCTVVRGTEETLMRCTLHTFLPALHTSHCTAPYVTRHYRPICGGAASAQEIVSTVRRGHLTFPGPSLDLIAPFLDLPRFLLQFSSLFQYFP